jgi:hypothetical protein
LNSKHYDYAYNHGPRKQKYAEEIDATKIIRKNDRVLEKYMKIMKQPRVKLNFAIIKAEGFDEGRFTRIVAFKKGDVGFKFHALYKYCYRILTQGDITYIEIMKL